MVPVEEGSAEAESGSSKPQSQPQVSAGMLWNSKESVHTDFNPLKPEPQNCPNQFLKWSVYRTF